jgi:hypothetical protein
MKLYVIRCGGISFIRSYAESHILFVLAIPLGKSNKGASNAV